MDPAYIPVYNILSYTPPLTYVEVVKNNSTPNSFMAES